MINRNRHPQTHILLLVVALIGCSDDRRAPATLKAGTPQSMDAGTSELGFSDTDMHEMGQIDSSTLEPDALLDATLDVSQFDATTSDFASEPDLPPLESGAHSFSHDGLERLFTLYLPDDLPDDAPLIYVMHGYSNFPEDIMTYSGMNDIADAHGFAICYPKGTVDEWGFHYFSVGYDFHQGTDVDDVSFIRALNQHLHARLDLNPNHVFATGMSNGAEMSYLLACQASDLFTAIAPVAGTMMKSFFDTCSPTKPIPVFAIHGTEDNITLYDGNLNDTEWGPYLGIASIISFWRQHDVLDQFEEMDLENSQPSDQSTITFERHYKEGSPAEVWLYRVEGGGHDWPGAWGNRDIQSSEEIWRFFSKYLD
jgi:polyhydroxybutyrate depolymerase